MTIFSPLIWKTHKKRAYGNICPHCGASIKWIYDGTQYYPCDEKPVLFTMHPEGRQVLIYRRSELDHCVLYDPKNPKCSGTPYRAYIQHFYTCPVLKQHREEYVNNLWRNNYGNKS